MRVPQTQAHGGADCAATADHNLVRDLLTEVRTLRDMMLAAYPRGTPRRVLRRLVMVGRQTRRDGLPSPPPVRVGSLPTATMDRTQALQRHRDAMLAAQFNDS